VPDVLAAGTAEDATTVVALRDAAAQWLLSRGIEQWRPGELSVDAMATTAAAGDLFVRRKHGAVVAAVVISWSDRPIWGADDGDAGYVHTLVIDRRHAGRGLGRAVLTDAEHLIAARDRRRVRLDCVRTNDGLRAYYRAAGYREVGERSFGGDWSPVTLFEKPTPAPEPE
jgi:ribosomal protein S18 acetylase RimI-like enzyme